MSHAKWLAVLASGLLVVGATILWIAHDSGATRRRSGQATAERIDGGLTLRLSMPPDPYFRDELLPVTLTLANHSGRAIGYAGSLHAGFCAIPTFDLMLNGSNFGWSRFPYQVAMGCPQMAWSAHGTPLLPGHSLTTTMFTWLPASGRLTLTARATFAADTVLRSSGLFDPGSGPRWLRRIVPGLFASYHAPFAAGWPTLTIAVSAARRPPHLRMVRQGHSVIVLAPPHTPALVLQQLDACENDDQVYTYDTTPDWVTLAGRGFHDPGCPGFAATSEQWKVTIGVPGASVITATYCFNPVPGPIFGGDPRAWRLLCTEQTRS